jgi:hypothetical protein
MLIKVLAFAAVTASLQGCISTPGTKVLVTPFGVAGVHSFKPQQTPDTIYSQAKAMDRMTAQSAAENGTDKPDKQNSQ